MEVIRADFAVTDDLLQEALRGRLDSNADSR